MKYVNSLKYMNSFEISEDISGVSVKRIRELCATLGRINIGTSSIFLPRCASGHAAAVMLESVIKHAGYKVGRITSVGGYDSRSIVYLDGEIPEIETYNRAVAELKAAVLKNTEEKYFKQEVSFALALLICKMHGCDYLIFEGTSGEGYSFDSICAPYDLVVIPTVLDGDESAARIASEAIRRTAREVISGNQKKNVYEMISSACVTGGVRLNFTSKLGFEVESVSARRLGFSYGGRSGYVIKSPSYIQRDCAMLVIETALAIRRDGVKLPWASISTGLLMAAETGCFELISASPVVIVDSASTFAEAELLASLINEIFGNEKLDRVSICVPDSASDLVGAFDKIGIDTVIVSGAGDASREGATVCKDSLACAERVAEIMKAGGNVVCLGCVDFATEIKGFLLKKING